MRTIVCLKRVPDTETRIRIDSSGVKVDPAGVKYVISPYDEYAIELALRAKEAAGQGEVELVTYGEPAAQEALRKGLAMGADSALLLTGEPGLDGLATAKTLAAELRGADAPLVLFGVKAADDDLQQVGPMFATLVGRACVTGVASFTLQADKVTCEREVDGATEVVEAQLPAVLTITKGPHEPRLASLKGIMAAKKKPLVEKPAAASPARVRILALREPAPRPAGRIVGQGPDAVPELVRLLRDEAKAI
ncbi:MAG: electron transfer flavoprotein subunit beta/FixA family protein [Gemmatimonadetes bacterium]|nr:electron transfer flavoprotein subunit beta/FixA family protein [Gemmatimonadota bacterium]